mmetsp:Transcript_53468/g.106373  ORF Transcript_53468/g.106373 Transcript_53468/m.106373 type:complete len:224 (-) Transcript_53468:194-865(-)
MSLTVLTVARAPSTPDRQKVHCRAPLCLRPSARPFRAVSGELAATRRHSPRPPPHQLSLQTMKRFAGLIFISLPVCSGGARILTAARPLPSSISLIIMPMHPLSSGRAERPESRTRAPRLSSPSPPPLLPLLPPTVGSCPLAFAAWNLSRSAVNLAYSSRVSLPFLPASYLLSSMAADDTSPFRPLALIALRSSCTSTISPSGEVEGEAAGAVASLLSVAVVP